MSTGRPVVVIQSDRDAHVVFRETHDGALYHTLLDPAGGALMISLQEGRERLSPQARRELARMREKRAR